MPVHPAPEELVGLFYGDGRALARFEEARAEEISGYYRELLDHENHMTVTVERRHASPVDVEVLEVRRDEHHYARKILLRRQSDRAVVQFGIMRLDFRCVGGEVQRAIESQQAPLGRILIEHDILRQIHLLKLWRVVAGSDLQKYFGLEWGRVTYGRTAVIDFNLRPAVELLEIVTPE